MRLAFARLPNPRPLSLPRRSSSPPTSILSFPREQSARRKKTAPASSLPAPATTPPASPRCWPSPPLCSLPNCRPPAPSFSPRTLEKKARATSAACATFSPARPTTPRTTLHCGTISGGTSVNSVPESATADLDLRSVSADRLDATEAQLLATVRSTVEAANTRTRPPLTLEIARIGNRPAAALAANSPLLTSLRAVDRHLHIATESRIGSTDANWPLSLGVPALAIGAGGTAGGIHTLREWYDPTGRELALRRILLHLLETCALAAGDA